MYNMKYIAIKLCIHFKIYLVEIHLILESSLMHNYTKQKLVHLEL